MAERIDDAGHGGSDPGAQSNGIIEKEYTLEAAKYVNSRLKELGIDSDMTRIADVTLDQKDRTSKTSRYKKGISHHYNAGGGGGAEFIHSIHADGKFEQLLLDEFKKAGYPVRPRPIYTRKWGKDDYYYMHRETGNCRITIVEYDFVDGPNAAKLKNKSYREGMYECVVRAVCREEGVKYMPVGKNDDITGAWGEKSIRKAIEKGIIPGYSDGTWRPNAPIKRADAAVILDRLGLLDKLK